MRTRGARPRKQILADAIHEVGFVPCVTASSWPETHTKLSPSANASLVHKPAASSNNNNNYRHLCLPFRINPFAFHSALPGSILLACARLVSARDSWLWISHHDLERNTEHAAHDWTGATHSHNIVAYPPEIPNNNSPQPWRATPRKRILCCSAFALRKRPKQASSTYRAHGGPR